MGTARRQEEMEKRKRSEQVAQRQMQILDQVHDCVISTDLEGIIQTWNLSAERIYGWSSAEAIGQHIVLLYFDEDRQVLNDDVLTPLVTKGAHEVTIRTRHKSGRPVFLDLRLSLLRDESGLPIGIIGCSSDVTTLKESEEALKRSQKNEQESLSFLAMLFSKAPVGLAFVDSDLRYVRINETLAEINGVAALAHLGHRPSEILPELGPTIESYYRRVVDTHQPILDREISGETPAHPGVRRHWLANYYPVAADDGVMLGVGVIVVETSERTRAQEAIRRERDFAEGLIETAQSIVLVLDPSGRIVRFNPYTEKLSGYRLEEVQGKDWFRTFLPERDRKRIRRIFGRSLQKVETRSNVYPIRTKDGTERQISWCDKPLLDGEGNVAGLLCVGQDITALLEAQERALRSERLAAIGQTIAAISHEARGDLLGMKMTLDLLANSVDDREQIVNCIERMRYCHEHLNHLFEDVRGFSAPVRLERSPCCISDIWQRAWASLETTWKNRSVSLQEAGVVNTTISADAFRLEQVFRNLFENSLSACVDPVQICVSCQTDVSNGHPALHISVRDNGPGLNQFQKEKIFEPFFTTKSRGTGLGMAIVRRIVEAHGGTITVGESPVPGAKFVIVLPR